MAIGGAIAAILAGLAAGASEGAIRNRQKEEEYTRSIIKEAGMKRAMSGDMGIFENPEFKKAMGPNAIKALMAVAQSVGAQTQQTQQAAGEARQSFFGNDPLGGADVGVPKIGAVAPGGAGPASQRPPGLAGPAALAQAVQPQAVEPMGEAPMPTAPPAPVAAAPSARPVTPFSRLQEGLGEGQTVSGEVGGMRFSVTGKVAGQDAGRAIVAEGVKQGLPYDQIVTNVFAAGGKLPENLSAYGEKQFMQAYRSALREAGGDSKSVTTQQKIAATRAAIEAGGKVPDAFKSQVGITREDEHALAGEVVAEAMKNGMSFGRAREYAESRGLRLSKEDEVAFGQRAYGDLKSELQKLLPDLSPEQLASLAAAGVKNDPRFVPPDERAAIREAAPMDEKTRARVYEQTGKVPRLSDVGGAVGGTIGGARKQVEQEEVGLAGQRAGTVKSAQEAVPERPSAGAQGAAIREQASRELGASIRTQYEGLENQFGGPLGLQGKITSLKARIGSSEAAAAAKLLSDTQLLRAEYIHALSGAQIGPSDQTVYLQRVPDLTRDSSVEFQANLNAVLDHMDRLARARADVEAKTGLRPTGERPTSKAGGMSETERRLREKYGIK